MADLHFKSNRLATGDGGTLISVDAARAGWLDTSFRVERVRAGEKLSGSSPGREVCFVFLGGRGSVRSPEGRFDGVGEREGVFAGLPHAVYLPVDSTWEIGAETRVEVAVCEARATKRFPARRIGPGEVEVEHRGDGNASRTIHHILPPEFPAEKLLIVEVFTPSGNWSSYPPHKHDQHLPPREHDLEEIYYYRVDRPGGFAIQRVYTADRRVDETMTVEDGDLVLVREGYHPVVAAPGYEVYYLNVLAGTGRSMAATDDPAHAWVRSTWKSPQRLVR